MLSHIVNINDSQKNYIDMLFGCYKSLLRQSYLLLVLPYVLKIKVPEKVKFQREQICFKGICPERIFVYSKGICPERIFVYSKGICHERIFVYHYMIAPKKISYIIHIKDIMRVQKKIISTSDIPNSFRLRASKRK